jgi:hypothetical protein
MAEVVGARGLNDVTAIPIQSRSGQPLARISRMGAVERIKKAFRETHNSLKLLKTAKSCKFWDQRYQILSKTHDFAGEAISFRFALFWFRPRRRIPSWDKRRDRSAPSKIWKTPRLAKNPFSAP